MSMHSKASLHSMVLVGAATMAMAMGSMPGCSREDDSLTADTETAQGVAPAPGNPALSEANPQIQAAMAVQDRHTPTLMEKNADIVGTATGLGDDGAPAIFIYLARELPQGTLPDSLDGIPVILQVTGPVKAFKSGTTTTVSHKAKQTAPIQLGTSGGWRKDLANGYCCGGTLGSLIQKADGTKYILSNWHVLYSDIVAGGNGVVAAPGDPVAQPGLIDVSCNANGSQTVGTLVAGGGSLPWNTENPGRAIDSGIAAVTPGMVKDDGSILEVGTLSSATAPAFVGQLVKKSGRTTGLGRAQVSGLNGTFAISYENECAGGAAFTQTYTGQIVTTNSRCKFLDGGDSGSLMVEDKTTNPSAVGLLYAGSSQCGGFAIAIANPINDVLSHYGATMVGVTPAP